MDQNFTRSVLSWYDAGHRDLPWRRTKDAYRIWVSEIMLQQTRAETVVTYYERFLARYPDVRALAVEPEEEFSTGTTPYRALPSATAAKTSSNVLKLTRSQSSPKKPTTAHSLYAPGTPL